MAERRRRGSPPARGFGCGSQPTVLEEYAMSRDGSVGVQGWARLFSSLVTWELAGAGGVGGETLCPGAGTATLELSGLNRDTVQCCTGELTFPSTLLSLAWLLFKLEFT